MLCPLCDHIDNKLWKQNSKFFFCVKCFLLFKDPVHNLTQEQEKARYLLHQNTLLNQGYRSLLENYLNELIPLLGPLDQILDYGSGPKPCLQQLLDLKGYKSDIYDHLFYPSFPDKSYPLISLHEVLEHFKNPKSELLKILPLLKPNGYLVVATQLWNESLKDSNWYYFKDPTHQSIFHYQSLEYLEHFGLKLIKSQSNAIHTFQYSKLEFCNPA